MRTHLVALATATGLTACLFPTGTTTPDPNAPPRLDKTLGSYVALARHSNTGYTDADGKPYGNGLQIGRVRSLTDPANDPAGYRRFASAVYPEMTLFHLAYDGIADGRICFSESASGLKSYQDQDSIARKTITEYDVTVEILDNLDAVATRPLLPSPGNKLDTAEVISDEIRDKDTDYGTIERVREIEWRVCGPAPEVTPNSKFLAVVVHGNQPREDKPLTSDLNWSDDALLLWEIVP